MATKRRTDHDVAAEFGERLRTHRESAGLSQERLAHNAGLSWSTVSQIERGERAVRLVTLLKLAEALRVDGGDLVRGIRAPTVAE